MFSGTRGVGKTTVARILAKAINCNHGPAAEPCNQCDLCRQITQGTSLDVVEIDGASHTGVDHVRKLTEDVSYVPLHCRYKVVIIDEAHMLSRSAFNALLKTLEEPPAHVCFILATTEPHKFPATIVSRCQHFVFKRVEQAELEGHMAWILEDQGLAYDPGALRVLARKGAGSVRDCLSLLSQVVALGETEIRTKAVQSLLGLAGQEMMVHCLQSLMSQDCSQILGLVQKLLDDGLDIGFFLQDLSQVWRNLFILKQSGEKGLSLLEMSEEEGRQWLAQAQDLSRAHIHAAWQMTLEGQKRVVSSPDPALALELMLMNLAFLPELVSLDQEDPGNRGSRPASARVKTGPGSVAEGGAQHASQAQVPGVQPRAEPPEAGDGGSGKRDWNGFLGFVQESKRGVLPNLHMVKGSLNGDRLQLICPGFLAQRLQDRDKRAWLQDQIATYFGNSLNIEIQQEGGVPQEDGPSLKKKILNEPAVQEALEHFAARVVDIQPHHPEAAEGNGNAYHKDKRG